MSNELHLKHLGKHKLQHIHVRPIGLTVMYRPLAQTFLASHTNALWGLPHNPPLPQMSSEAKGTFFPFCVCMSCTIKGVTFDPEKCEEGWGLNTAGYFN